jgi:hypothetical protein
MSLQYTTIVTGEGEVDATKAKVIVNFWVERESQIQGTTTHYEVGLNDLVRI